MRFYICNGNGDSLNDPSPDAMREMLTELDPNYEEHGAAWVADAADNTLEWSVDGTMAYARPGESSRHLNQVSIERAVGLWLKLVDGRFDELERQAWLPGAHDPLSADERARLDERFAAIQRAQDRELYDELGAERPGTRCRHPGCERGTVAFSVLCKPHHFESIRGRPSPFDDA